MMTFKRRAFEHLATQLEESKAVAAALAQNLHECEVSTERTESHTHYLDRVIGAAWRAIPDEYSNPSNLALAVSRVAEALGETTAERGELVAEVNRLRVLMGVYEGHMNTNRRNLVAAMAERDQLLADIGDAWEAAPDGYEADTLADLIKAMAHKIKSEQATGTMTFHLEPDETESIKALFDYLVSTQTGEES